MRTRISVFLITLSGLILEVGLTRIYSASSWYHFAFVAISVALLGWGLGVFPVIYPQFRSFYTNVVVNRAHDDYLQLLAEMGALGFATMLWFLVVLYRSSIKKLDNWAINISGAISLAALLGCAGILVHGFVDSNLQIPANAALFYVLCVLAASKPLTESRRRRRSHGTEMPETGVLPEAV